MGGRAPSRREAYGRAPTRSSQALQVALRASLTASARGRVSAGRSGRRNVHAGVEQRNSTRVGIVTGPRRAPAAERKAGRGNRAESGGAAAQRRSSSFTLAASCGSENGFGKTRTARSRRCSPGRPRSGSRRRRSPWSGLRRRRLLQQRRPVHLGHDDVAHDDVDDPPPTPAPPAPPRRSRPPAPRSRAERAHGEAAHHVLVLDQEHATGPGEVGPGRGFLTSFAGDGSSRGSGSAARQVDAKRRPLARFTLGTMKPPDCLTMP